LFIFWFIVPVSTPFFRSALNCILNNTVLPFLSFNSHHNHKLMKAILLMICTGMVLSISVWSQAPHKMTFQAVVRNASDELVTDTQAGARISILQGAPDGPAVFVETHTPEVNSNGLMTLEIGTGMGEQGEFSAIDWAIGPYFLKTETDPDGGDNYSISSVSQLMSVPYALYAESAGNAVPGPPGEQGPQGPPGD
jgi:hypothetical protein